jgi:hypothetical protein
MLETFSKSKKRKRKRKTVYLMPTPPPNYYFKKIAVTIQNFGLFSQTNNMSNPDRK